jgi:hypothetical protein
MQAASAILLHLHSSRTPDMPSSRQLKIHSAFDMQTGQPLVAEAYRHAPLDHTTASIRLIHLQPDLSKDGPVEYAISLDTTGASYTCLSYRWGAPEPNGVIRVDGKLFRVRQNLLDFLHIARQNKDATKVYWIDALCIDQSNVLERNHQIAQMGQIYSSAACVHVWLGARPDLEPAFRLLESSEESYFQN